MERDEAMVLRQRQRFPDVGNTLARSRLAS